MAEHLDTTFRPGVSRFRIPGPFGELMYDGQDGTRYQITDATPAGAFVLRPDGRLVLVVTVSGNRYSPPNFNPVTFGPEDWDFAVTQSLGISVTLEVAPDKTNEAPETYTPAVVLADLTGADAISLDKHIRVGRLSRAAELLTQILS